MSDRNDLVRRAWVEAFRRWPNNGSTSHDRNMDRRRGGFVDGALWQASPCTDHKPVQHRDGKPPWCKRCGMTADFQTPISRIRREFPEPVYLPTPAGHQPTELEQGK